MTTMADILSQSKIDALLTATGGDGAESGGIDEVSAQRIITPYDFKHPARVNKDQLRTLENLHDNFARLLSSTFSGAMRAVVDVDTAFVDQTTYAEFIASLSNPSCSYQFILGPTSGCAIIDVAMPVVFSFVDRIFGGKGSSQGVAPRQLTPIEIGVINRIAKRVIEDLEATWEPILRVEITDIELETNPEFMQITAAGEIIILMAFEVNSVNASGLVSLCYPFFTLESILPRLGQQSYVRTNRMNPEEMRSANRARLAQTEVEVVAELARGQITLAEARRLRVGDVVGTAVGRTEPAVLFVGDQPTFLARPCRGCTNQMEAKIAAVIPPHLAEGYRNRCQPIPE
jgi:flagellar motor switch protein FliM